MSFKDQIEQNRKSANAIFHRFRTDPNIRLGKHVFVEGLDDVCHYQHVLARQFPGRADAPRFHVCWGKRNLDRVVELLNRATALEHGGALFIRDSDYDRFLGTVHYEPQLFLTCGYSVENYVCTATAIKEFMISSCALDPLEYDIDGAIATHINNVHVLFKWLSPLFGAILFAIRAGAKLELDNLDMKRHYKTLQEGGVLPVSLVQSDWEMSGLQNAHFNDVSQSLGVDYVTQDAVLWFRGKQLLDFTSMFMATLHAHLQIEHKSHRLLKFRRANSDFSRSSVFEKLSANATPTPLLIAALSRMTVGER